MAVTIMQQSMDSMPSVYWYLVLAAGDTKENKRAQGNMQNRNLGDLRPWNTGGRRMK